MDDYKNSSFLFYTFFLLKSSWAPCKVIAVKLPNFTFEKINKEFPNVFYYDQRRWFCASENFTCGRRGLLRERRELKGYENSIKVFNRLYLFLYFLYFFDFFDFLSRLFLVWILFDLPEMLRFRLFSWSHLFRVLHLPYYTNISCVFSDVKLRIHSGLWPWPD